MSNELARTTEDQWAVMEKVVVQGDLSKLTPPERVAYYRAVCESVGLNPLTQPFAYITLNGKLTLYALKSATDQVRKVHHVNVSIVSRERIEDVYVVTARAMMPDGRTDESIGAVAIAGLKGDGLANALMKAETKAKRRVTLSIVGLGMLDESETETIPGARFPERYNSEPMREVDSDGQGVPESLAPGEAPIEIRGKRATADDMDRISKALAGPLTTGAYTLLLDEIERFGIGDDPTISMLVHEADQRRGERAKAQPATQQVAFAPE